jgi:hypothetical protein
MKKVNWAFLHLMMQAKGFKYFFLWLGDEINQRWESGNQSK